MIARKYPPVDGEPAAPAGTEEDEQERAIAELMACRSPLSPAQVLLFRQVVYPAIFRAEYPRVCAALRRKGVPDANVDDEAQDVFLLLLRQSHNGLAENIRRKLLRIARSRASNHRRRAERNPESPGIPSSGSEKPISNQDAEGPLERAKRARRFRYALSEKHRDVIDLVIIDGLSQQDAADELEIPRTTVKSRLEAALRLLKEMEKAFLPPESEK